MTGAELRTLRQALGLSQLELAQRLGRARYTISRWETGRHRIRDGRTLRLAIEGLRATITHERGGTPCK
jgi:transcriptional regulator with XRE-family HTH domain